MRRRAEAGRRPKQGNQGDLLTNFFMTFFLCRCATTDLFGKELGAIFRTRFSECRTRHLAMARPIVPPPARSFDPSQRSALSMRTRQAPATSALRNATGVEIIGRRFSKHFKIRSPSLLAPTHSLLLSPSTLSSVRDHWRCQSFPPVLPPAAGRAPAHARRRCRTPHRATPARRGDRATSVRPPDRCRAMPRDRRPPA